MDAYAIFNRTSSFVIGLETKDQSGDIAIGSAFHVGDGFFVTAGHVVADREISGVVNPGGGRLTKIYSVRQAITPGIDLALLSTDFLAPGASGRTVDAESPGIEIGFHLDDWIGDSLILSSVLMIGFPPVPTSKYPVIVAATGEVNAIVDRFTTPGVHFAVSSPARGGFSGGPVLTSGGWLLGVVTESLLRDDGKGEPGFAVALSVEPIFILLEENRIAPRANRLSCFLFNQIGDELDIYGDLLTAEERQDFIAWSENMQSNPEPRSMGRPSPPIQDENALWEASARRGPGSL